MKVLFVCHIANSYGANRSLIELAKELRKKDVFCTFILPKEDSFCSILQREDFPFEIFPVSWWVEPVPALLRYRAKEDFSPDNLPKELITFTRNLAPHLIHSNSVVTPDGYLLAKSIGIPHVWQIRELCKEHYHFRYSLGEDLVLSSLSDSDSCIANSEAAKNAYFSTSTDANVTVIYNPVSAPAELPERSSTSQSVAKLLSIGHMSEEKGHHHAILALADIRERGINARLTIVGGGDNPYRERCLALVRELHLDSNVTFLRSVDDPWQILSDSDLFLQCSQHEAFGRVTVEAMLARCPVLGRNSGGTPEIIEHGKTGYLFDDPETLGESICSVLQDSEKDRIVHNAFEIAIQRFNPQQIAQQVREVYQRAITE